MIAEELVDRKQWLGHGSCNGKLSNESSVEAFRKMQAEELSRTALGDDEKKCTPLGITVLLAGVSRLLVLENSLGITLGHREGTAMIERLLCWLETAPQQGSQTRRTRSPRARQIGRKGAAPKPRASRVAP